jgi:hypothetical protein
MLADRIIGAGVVLTNIHVCQYYCLLAATDFY